MVASLREVGRRDVHLLDGWVFHPLQMVASLRGRWPGAGRPAPRPAFPPSADGGFIEGRDRRRRSSTAGRFHHLHMVASLRVDAGCGRRRRWEFPPFPDGGLIEGLWCSVGNQIAQVSSISRWWRHRGSEVTIYGDISNSVYTISSWWIHWGPSTAPGFSWLL